MGFNSGFKGLVCWGHNCLVVNCSTGKDKLLACVSAVVNIDELTSVGLREKHKYHLGN